MIHFSKGTVKIRLAAHFTYPFVSLYYPHILMLHSYRVAFNDGAQGVRFVFLFEALPARWAPSIENNQNDDYFAQNLWWGCDQIKTALYWIRPHVCYAAACFCAEPGTGTGQKAEPMRGDEGGRGNPGLDEVVQGWPSYTLSVNVVSRQIRVSLGGHLKYIR